MVSPFAAADALSSAAVSSVYAEALMLIPWKPAGSWTEGGADPDRPQVMFQGVLSGAVDSQNLKGDEKGSDFIGTATTRDRRVSCDNSEWPDLARVGDRIQALDKPGLPTYEITSIVPDLINRTWANLVVSK